MLMAAAGTVVVDTAAAGTVVDMAVDFMGEADFTVAGGMGADSTGVDFTVCRVDSADIEAAAWACRVVGFTADEWEGRRAWGRRAAPQAQVIAGFRRAALPGGISCLAAEGASDAAQPG